MAYAVSAVIPVKNRPTEIIRAVNSILAQTVVPQEIVIVDDGSTDSTPAVISQLAEEHPIIKPIFLSKSRGASGARNEGCRAASGDMLALLDSDDEWLPEKMELQLKLLSDDEKCPAAGCGMKYDYIDRPSVSRVPPRVITLEHLSQGNIFGSASVALIRKSSFMDIGGFDESLPNCEDWDLWFRLSQISSLLSTSEIMVRYSYDGNDKLSRNIDKLILGHNMMRDKILASVSNQRQRNIIIAAHEMKMAEIAVRTIGSPSMGFKHAWKSLSANAGPQNVTRALKLLAAGAFYSNRY
ncbi:glycosyltransferase family 2 protein [Rhizobium sp. CF142]|uniref:glycosyltransferase family 2 protein n=1 Tax=Rhizobium sp. CF142 TaxID=1144314 RepID=UPI00026EF6CC|nr:glycosyltransferase family A protein [Rhizobium sp. CF142]EJJ26380.1 glycosyl transferase [Rhizobium sp. CF142]